MASWGELIVIRRPSRNTSPPSFSSAPKSARINSERPEPISPAKPSTSPRCRLKLHPCVWPGRRRSRTSSSTGPRSALFSGYMSVSSRPTIIRITSAGVVSAVIRVPM